MTEAVGACALAVVAYMAARPRVGAPLWTLKAITYPPSPSLDIDPTATRIRHSGDRLPIRRHDGTGRSWDERDAFVPPPRLPDPLPDPGPGPEGPHPEPPSTEDGDAAALRIDIMAARLNAWLDTEYVALCERLHVEPVAVTHTVRHKPKSKKETGHGKEQHGSTRQAGGLLARTGGDRGNHRGRRRVRGGVRVA